MSDDFYLPSYWLEMDEILPEGSTDEPMQVCLEVSDYAEAVALAAEFRTEEFVGVPHTARMHTHYHNPQGGANKPCEVREIP